MSPAILEETRDRQQQANERLRTAKAAQDKAKVPQELAAVGRELNELAEKVSNLRQVCSPPASLLLAFHWPHHHTESCKYQVSLSDWMLQ